MTDQSFEGSSAVITGGTGALGRAVVAQLLDRGAICHVPVFDADELADFALRDHDRVRLHHGVDVRDEAAVARLYDGLDDLAASIHVAGGFAMAPIAEADAASLRDQLEMNVVTCFLCCRAAVVAMRRHGRGGRLVNVAARPALEPRLGAGMTVYTASKAAVAALSVALGEELAGEAIWVNAVAPSIIDTPANRAAMPDAAHGTWASADAIARTIVFLASSDNAVTRSGVVPVYGRS
ncbi:MAG: SDR family NAD(P)-dependent oxidoreductase [Acidobacteriota bacterium]